MCKLCRTIIDKRAELCLSCRKQQRLYDSGLQTVGSLKASRGIRWKDIIRQHASKIIDTTGKSCEWCDYDKHVQRAHIRDVATFPDSTPIAVINDPANIKLLCPNHHWEFDNL